MKDLNKIVESQYRALLKEKEALIKQTERNAEKIEKVKRYLEIMEIKIEEQAALATDNPPLRKRGRPRKVQLVANVA